MNKINNLILLLFVFLGIGLVFPATSLADCIESPITSLICLNSTYKIHCGKMCCSSAQDDPVCPEYQSPKPTPMSQDDYNAKYLYCGTDNKGIQTAIGCIPVLGSTNEFLATILKWAVGIGGGIAFLLILYSGFMIMTASGSPERLQAGKELLTSAIMGLILLVFSVFILKFIGLDILGLGQFGFGK